MINLGLSRISALVSQLPTRRTWKAVHVAGTNGKGSVAAYLSSLFAHCCSPENPVTELKVGRFTSPHVIDRWDCITINDQPVSESLFLRVEREVKTYAENVEAEPVNRETSLSSTASAGVAGVGVKHDDHDHDDAKVTEFELLTATAFEIFSQQQCQIAIVECGLGGRLDATTVLSSDDVVCSVITKIGLDHMGMLGDTMEEIAREKAGIVKENVPLVIDGTNSPNVIRAIEEVARQKNVTPSLSGFKSSTTSSSPSSDMTTWNISTSELSSYRIPPHQRDNLLLSFQAFTMSQPRLQKTQNLTFDLSPATTKLQKLLPTLLQDVQKSYPARLQHLSISPLIPSSTRSRSDVLLDGAHNPQSARVLREYIDTYLLPNPNPDPDHDDKPSERKTGKETNVQKGVTFIMSMTSTKPSSSILHELLCRPRDDKLVLCPFGPVDGMPWIHCADPDDVADVAVAQGFLERKNVHVVRGTVVDALRLAVTLGHEDEDENGEGEGECEGGSDRPIVVAGSLYLASDLLRALRDGEDVLKRRFCFLDS